VVVTEAGPAASKLAPPTDVPTIPASPDAVVRFSLAAVNSVPGLSARRHTGRWLLGYSALAYALVVGRVASRPSSTSCPYATAESRRRLAVRLRDEDNAEVWALLAATTRSGEDPRQHRPPGRTLTVEATDSTCASTTTPA
jgi:hypothetical protein